MFCDSVKEARNLPFCLVCQTNRRCDEKKVASAGYLWISPRDFIYLRLFTLICWWALLSRFSKLLLQNKIGATGKHKSKTEMHGIMRVTFRLHMLYDLSSFSVSLWHHLVPAECQVTYFLTKWVLRTILRWYQNTRVQLCMAFSPSRFEVKTSILSLSPKILSLLPRASFFFRKTGAALALIDRIYN